MKPRTDSDHWARPVTTLSVSSVPHGAKAATVTGRRVAGPLQGFGQMWQKTFRVRLEGADPSLAPKDVVAAWKDRFSTFWPRGNTFYAPLAGIRPGEVALFSVAAAGPVKLHSGVVVIYADDDAFTLMTPEGHMLSAWITFTAYRATDGTIIAEARALERASDPFFEVGLMLFGHRANNRFWAQTLRNLAAHFGAEADAEAEVVCIDRRRQWRHATNVRYNAAIRGMLHTAGAPVRWTRTRLAGRR